MSPDWLAYSGPDGPQSLADRMHAAWVCFATTVDPGWRAWDERRPVLVFDEPTTRVEDGLRDEILTAWRDGGHVNG
jgi:para-nitrobenzyl esterase